MAAVHCHGFTRLPGGDTSADQLNLKLDRRRSPASGVDDSVRQKFPGADVIYASGASGAGDNREIPLSEGRDLDPRMGRPYKARDFEGVGGPEDKDRIYDENNPGNDDVRGNVRQGGDTVRPAGSMAGKLKK
ncbi:hypothetical protein BU26DRAFT_604145 [Trematosphaeria pertusa]|uniref:Uncharacterized protein n=1 Tax=Trematosphaeria pertusa TaxID=390896 RepID=A0A6A6IHH7_9PLEO|nr:uncharacterized protein BU26DRAFT_604145 [Trematosphaeria pertusa]KAF2249836.1 hypothetical protein BU26DRAFT_604145 [Trematosphaeria pertusa]